MRRRGIWCETLLTFVPALVALAIFFLKNMGRSWAALGEAAGIMAIFLLFGGSIYALLRAMPTWSASWLGVSCAALPLIMRWVTWRPDFPWSTFTWYGLQGIYFGSIIAVVLIGSRRDWTFSMGAALSWANALILTNLHEMFESPGKLIAGFLLVCSWGLAMSASISISHRLRAIALSGGLMVGFFLNYIALYICCQLNLSLQMNLYAIFLAIFLMGPAIWFVRNRVLAHKTTQV